MMQVRVNLFCEVPVKLVTTGSRKKQNIPCLSEHLVSEGNGDVHVNNRLHSQSNPVVRAVLRKSVRRLGVVLQRWWYLASVLKDEDGFHGLKRGWSDADRGSA